MSQSTCTEKKIRYATPNRMTKWRVDSLLEKEPATIAWLGEFTAADVLVDVGANVGMYSVLVAAWKGCRVYAFEPEALNFALLNRNIHGNNLDKLVTAYPAALGDRAGLSVLHLSSVSAGNSGHSLDASVDFKLAPRKSAFVQGSVAARLDDLVRDDAIPQPTRIKIDVDGFEHKVVDGALKTITDPRLHSLLIEINEKVEEHCSLVERIVALGFRFDPAQVESVKRQEGPFAGTAEYVFRR